VREYFIPFRMMPDRMEQVSDRLRPLATTPVNRDFTPVAYYFNIALWSAQFNPGWSRWFRAAAHVDFAWLMATALALAILLAALLALAPARPTRAPSAAICSVAATGFTLMALEVFLLLAFQSIYGYVYRQLAILIGLSMAGIALGSWLGMRRMDSGDRARCRALAATQLLLGLSAPLLICAASLLGKLSGGAATWLAAQCVFPALAALSGVLGGYQFPIATGLYLDDGNGRRSLGALYAVDLLGGCAGALLLSTYLIPVFGFWKTAWLCAAINLAPLLLALRMSLVMKHAET
jgi:spermidine synthase